MTSNVEKFLAREDELRLARKFCDDQAVLGAKAAFEEKGVRKFGRERIKRESKMAAEEVECLNYEVTQRRRACLKEFYEQQQAMYEEELSALGLTLVKERL
eukprot:CAMPEP_0182573362 /NCGR_PEP_ID=MMETSP1324-20130603/19726_1 /TAXON_ID=236786 /ORGANISM="Florenciella sp., Strain RCC1587" /LENGTH=100 /DNA_ID=CAMNT_0024788457 /DNA_START=37 /DNA_END=339 /DNA_ORIENTATION=+